MIKFIENGKQIAEIGLMFDEFFANCGAGVISIDEMFLFSKDGKTNNIEFEGEDFTTAKQKAEALSLLKKVSKVFTNFLYYGKNHHNTISIECNNNSIERNRYYKAAAICDRLRIPSCSMLMCSDIVGPIPNKDKIPGRMRRDEFVMHPTIGHVAYYGGWYECPLDWKNCNGGNILRMWQLPICQSEHF